MTYTIDVENVSTYELNPFSKSQQIDIEDLVRTKLLPMPSSITRILEFLRDENVKTSQISDVIEYDPILATRVLRLANSPIYSLQREVTNIRQAIASIGLTSLYDIVMLGMASDAFSNKVSFLGTGVTIWEHSVAVAIASREIGRVLKIRGADESFTCGLLHDIGKSLLYQADPDSYQFALSQESEEELIKVEEDFFGYNHYQVGFFVAHKWELPEAVKAAILYHHNPSEASQAVVISNIVNVADDLIAAKGFGLQQATEDVYPESESVAKLKLSPEQMEKVWADTKVQLDSAIESLK